MTWWVVTYLVAGVLLNMFGTFHFMRRGQLMSALYWFVSATWAGVTLLIYLSQAEAWR